MVTELQLQQANFHCKHTWTLEELEDIQKRYLAKESMAEISESYKMSAISIARVLGIMGIESRARGKVPALTAEQKVQALVMLENHTQQEVADRFGVSRWIIQKAHAAHRSVCNE
ncbi:hypothetical protein [Pseudomonas sp. P8_250]|uniref:hypothetical protein n=1 Tax=Pseudomonas sp. P8_250 TaxID=3043446 RepID=UPI002A36046E|nr:hypothetical protein [Pseudomonas sp. P8_250]MDX9668710.1 hypothetical protein [Pseudomonas sp. P8_250]